MTERSTVPVATLAIAKQLDEFSLGCKKAESLIAAVRDLAGCGADDDRPAWPASVETVTSMLQDAVTQLLDTVNCYEELAEAPSKQDTGELLKLACSVGFLQDVIEASGQTMPSSSFQTVDIFNLVETPLSNLHKKMGDTLALALFSADEQRQKLRQNVQVLDS